MPRPDGRRATAPAVRHGAEGVSTRLGSHRQITTTTWIDMTAQREADDAVDESTMPGPFVVVATAGQARKRRVVGSWAEAELLAARFDAEGCFVWVGRPGDPSAPSWARPSERAR